MRISRTSMKLKMSKIKIGALETKGHAVSVLAFNTGILTLQPKRGYMVIKPSCSPEGKPFGFRTTVK